ncbi:response regulator [Rhizobium sp. CFBP 8762]|uniref:response regulator n=1 Tax=Rhizobium sp. CFBP 8762 TaxID=2775279 RepID=UPI0017801888|nr:response regulator [Rhizobium sp. CFBP 8762]MBD8553328.1 response regulator [Rhizobium sp. CFBP 8762]
MIDVASLDAGIQRALFEAGCEATGTAMVLYNGEDHLMFASRQVLNIYNISTEFLLPGTRLRDFLGAVHDSGLRAGTSVERRPGQLGREDWISRQVAYHWRERYETVERFQNNRWVHIHKRRLSSGYGLLYLTDITERRQREQEQELDAERIALTEDILDSLPNPLVIKDQNLIISAVNRAFCAIHRLERGDMLGRTAWDLLEAEFARQDEALDTDVLQTGQPSASPQHLVRADGQDFWAIVRKYRLGKPGRYFIITSMEDVTDIAIWEGEEGARSSGHVGANARFGERFGKLRLKDYSIFKPAASFYDPFRNMKLADLFKSGPPVPEALKGQRVLVVTANRLFEAQLLPQLRVWGFDACAVCSADEYQMFMEQAAHLDLPIDLALVDQDFVGLPAFDRTGPMAYVPIQSDQPISTILQHMITRGTDSPVSLPQPLGSNVVDFAEWSLASAATASHDRIDVLVAEDNRINQFVFSQILDTLGLTYRIAADGSEALRLAAKHRPRMLFLDLTLPQVSGLDVARRIRATETATRMPIVAVVSVEKDFPAGEASVAGMDDHITKPVSPDMIERMFERYGLEDGNGSRPTCQLPK